MFDIGGYAVEIDEDHLIISLSGAGTVVAAVFDGTTARLQLTKPDGVYHFAVTVEHHAGSIKIDFTAAAKHAEQAFAFCGIPSQTDMHSRNTGTGLFCQGDGLIFTE